MKKRTREISIQFWVSETENQKIRENMEHHHFTSVSEFLRMRALMEIEVTYEVKSPVKLDVDEMHLEKITEEGKKLNRASGQ